MNRQIFRFVNRVISPRLRRTVFFRETMATCSACVKEKCQSRKEYVAPSVIESAAVLPSDPGPSISSTAHQQPITSPPLSPREPQQPNTSPPLSPRTHQQADPGPPVAPKAHQPAPMYRRPLPETCISFASEEGKKIFMEALASGHMNCYFRLASQFRTQDEPAYCGLATMVMALNALEIDPGRVWKGPWRWYHEDMLDCCVPTALVRKQGITFDEFICLARCNSIDTESVRADNNASEENFRDSVRQMTVKEDTFLIVSYSRKVLGQTGDGHFAPVSGYHPKKDLVLILDTARFKYPPHWVPLPLLFKSMQALDAETGRPRGYIKVWAAREFKTLLLFKLSDSLGINSSGNALHNIQDFLSNWTQLLSGSLEFKNGADLQVVLAETIRGLVALSTLLPAEKIILTTQHHIQCTQQCKVQCIVHDLLCEIEQTTLFHAICVVLEDLSEADIHKLETIFGIWPKVVASSESNSSKFQFESKCTGTVCDLSQGLCLCHFITAFVLSWPYALTYSKGTFGAALNCIAQDTMNKSPGKYLMDEVSTIRRQLKQLIGYHSTPSLSCNIVS